MTNQHFEEFARRTMPRRELPGWMNEGAPPPASWLGDPAEWIALREEAKAAWRLRPILEFAEAIVRGWRPHELASGQLDGRATIGVLDGSVRRTEPLDSPELRQRAAAVLAQAGRERVRLDPIIAVDLEAMRSGSWGGRGGAEKCAAAERAVREAEAAAAAEKSQERQRPTIEVGHGFRAMGRQFAAGRYAVDPGVLQELRTWEQKLLAQAKTHNWEEPSGFEGKWPPFVVVGQGRDDAGVTKAGALT